MVLIPAEQPQVNLSKLRSRVNDKVVFKLVGEWSRVVRLLDLKLMKAHGELLERKCGSTCAPEKLVEIYGLWKDNPRENEG